MSKSSRLRGRWHNSTARWEEDPNWQKANYWLFLFIVAALTAGVAVWSAWVGEWRFLGYWILGLMLFLAALCIYAAFVWMSAQLIAWLRRLFKPDSRRNHDL